jgi:hypothetical protein
MNPAPATVVESIVRWCGCSRPGTKSLGDAGRAFPFDQPLAAGDPKSSYHNKPAWVTPYLLINGIPIARPECKFRKDQDCRCIARNNLTEFPAVFGT